MTADTTRRPIPEQTARHVYRGTVPARASMATVQEPSASRHYAGHSVGIHPEDTPRMTTAGQRAWQPRSQNPAYAPPDNEEDAALYPQSPPTSVRRYKPATPSGLPRQKSGRFYALVVGISIFTGIVIASVVPSLWQQGSDQLHYGFPRTYQVDANVGHGSKQYPDTHFIALNNHGYIEVVEIPEGMPGKNMLPQLYMVAQPYSAGADRIPATLTFADVNGDGKTDMIVHCNGNEIVLYNDGHTFRQTP